MTHAEKRNVDKVQKSGLYIAFEGVGAAGKSTQIKLLSQRFQDQGVPFLLVKEPGGSDFYGQVIRDLLLQKEEYPMTNITELMLFMADRNQLLTHTVLPYLATGGTVISDRSVFSSMAYQGHTNGMLSQVFALCAMAVPRLPDIVFLLDLPAEESCRRRKTRDDRFTRDVAYYDQVRKGYQYVSTFPLGVDVQFVILDGTKTIEELHATICNTLERVPK